MGSPRLARPPAVGAQQEVGGGWGRGQAADSCAANNPGCSVTGAACLLATTALGTDTAGAALLPSAVTALRCRHLGGGGAPALKAAPQACSARRPLLLASCHLQGIVEQQNEFGRLHEALCPLQGRC